MLRRRRHVEPELVSLRRLLQESLDRDHDGWLMPPEGAEWELETRGTIRDLDVDDLAEQDSEVVVIAGQRLAAIVDGATLHDICRGAALLQTRPSDETLLEAFRYYARFDAFLPALGAPVHLPSRRSPVDSIESSGTSSVTSGQISRAERLVAIAEASR